MPIICRILCLRVAEKDKFISIKKMRRWAHVSCVAHELGLLEGRGSVHVNSAAGILRQQDFPGKVSGTPVANFVEWSDQCDLIRRTYSTISI